MPVAKCHFNYKRTKQNRKKFVLKALHPTGLYKKKMT